MLIAKDMDLCALAERMGDCATETEARALRDILIERGYEGRATSDIPEDEWLSLLAEAVRAAEDENEGEPVPPPRYYRVCPRGFANEVDYIRADSDEDRKEIDRHFAGYIDRMFDEGETHAFAGWVTRPPAGYFALPWRAYKALMLL